MSTLTVLMPPRDATLAATDWQLPALRFVLTDRRGRTVNAGTAALGLLPKAAATVLILAARDVLLVDAVVPPLASARLRQTLPNIIEDQLLSDGPAPHIAVGPGASGARQRPARRTVAAIDRAWLRFLHESMTNAGHRQIRAVPLLACLPMVPSAPEVLAAVASTNAAHTVVPTTRPRKETPDGAVSSLLGDTQQSGALSHDADTAVGVDVDLSDDEAARLAAVEAAERAEAHALAASATILIVGGQKVQDDFLVEIAIRRLPVPPVGSQVPVAAERLSGEGMIVPIDALIETLSALLPGNAIAGDAGKGREIYRLTDKSAPSPLDGIGLATTTATFSVPASSNPMARDDDAVTLDGALRAMGIAPKPLDFATLAEAARTSAFDVCQFEFTAQSWRMRPEAWRQVRVPLGLLAASALVAIIGINIQWLQLARQRDAVQSAMTALLLEAFPRTTVVLDPAVQMRRSLDSLRIAAGELSPDDFLSLTNGVSSAMGGIPPTAIASLDYDHRTLQLTFKNDAQIDPAFRERLGRNGLEGSVDGKRWTIRSSR